MSLNNVPPLNDEYSKLWRREKSDSPESSIACAAGLVIEWMKNRYHKGGVIADLGSGPQPLEKEVQNRMLAVPVLRDTVNRNQFNILSFDFAKILSDKLMQIRRLTPFGIVHSQADIAHIPLSKASVDLVISNHAIDFAGEKAFEEAARILKPGGDFVFIFHHPNLWNDSAFERLSSNVIKFWQYLHKNNVLFENESSIIQSLNRVGLQVDRIKLVQQTVAFEKETYWVVTGHK